MNDTKIAWWRYPVSVLAFWALALFGGALLMLWNALSPRMLRYEQGDLGYFIMQILTGPFGVWLGHKALVALIGGRASQFSMINCVVMATLLLGLCAFNLVFGVSDLAAFLSVLAAGIFAAYFAWVDSTEVKQNGHHT